MVKLFPLSALILGLTASSSLSQISLSPVNSAAIFDSIQKETSWKASGSSQSYNSKTLGSLRPRDAAIFDEYGFKRADSQNFAKGGNSISVQIFEMEDTPAAYGIFTLLREKTAKPLEGAGHLGQLRDSDVLFIQNSYFVKLNSDVNDPALQPSLVKMAQVISKMLPKPFAMPSLVARLPKENLSKGSEFFALGSLALNQKLPLGNKDIFGLADGAEAALADYQFSEDSFKLLLLYYPTQQLAKKYLEAGYKVYSAQNPHQSVFYRRDGPQVALILGAKSAEDATALLEKISYVSTVSWDPKAHPVSVAQMMLNIFTYIGVMLALTFGAGLLLGVLRIVLRRRYPGRFFDRPEAMEIIRLNLKP
jgi:hypothetical protein